MLYDSWLATCYNACFTLLPVLAYAMLEQDLSYEVSMQSPFLYREGQQSKLLNRNIFMLWVANGLFDSLVMYVVPYLSLGIAQNGFDFDINMNGVLMYTVVVIVVTGRLCLQTQHFTWISAVCYLGTVLAWFLYIIVECASVPGIFCTGYYWVFYNLLTTSFYWLACTLAPGIALLPAFTYKMARQCFYPSESQEAQNTMLAIERRRMKKFVDGEIRRTTSTGADLETERARKRDTWLRNVEGSDQPTPMSILSGQNTLTPKEKVKSATNAMIAQRRMMKAAKDRRVSGGNVSPAAVVAAINKKRASRA